MYGFVGGNFYGSKSSFSLDKIQCEATFIPTTFHVQVAVSTNDISVTALPNATTQGYTDIDSSCGLVNATFFCPSSLSQILTTGYTSVFGDAFKVNADNVRARSFITISQSRIYSQPLPRALNSCSMVVLEALALLN